MSIDSIPVALSVVLGSCRIPIAQAIALTRNTPLLLDPSPDDGVDILANGRLIARGRVVVKGDRIWIEIVDRVTSSKPLSRAA
jgi:flagellar motor switch protein FliN/FliY